MPNFRWHSSCILACLVLGAVQHAVGTGIASFLLPVNATVLSMIVQFLTSRPLLNTTR